MHQWSPEIDIDECLARRLIRGQFPVLRVRSLRLLGEGWDNAVWLVDETVAFRFPRRAIALPGVQREMDILPRLRPHLPLPIPEARFLGQPTQDYPWPFFGGPLLPGVEVCDAVLNDGARLRLGAQLGAFLAALHTSDLGTTVTGAARLAVDPMGRADMARRVPMAREGLDAAARLGLWRAPPSVDRLLKSATLLGPAEPNAIVHGDLHFRHLLVDRSGAVTGVIDWGDVCRGPNSIDLPLVWSLLPPKARPAFFDAYLPVSEEELLRARVLALLLCAILAVYGHHEGKANVAREAVAGLDLAVRD